jgi:hypothetical protein
MSSRAPLHAKKVSSCVNCQALLVGRWGQSGKVALLLPPPFFFLMQNFLKLQEKLVLLFLEGQKLLLQLQNLFFGFLK